MTKKNKVVVWRSFNEYCYSSTSNKDPQLTENPIGDRGLAVRAGSTPRTQVMCSQYADQRHYMISVHSTCVLYTRVPKFNNIQRCIFSPFTCKHLISLYEHELSKTRLRSILQRPAATRLQSTNVP